ncbi:hypothetical protein CHU93_12945, partial [Sandarakinorhabdus cyanobacteriorum]
ATLITYTTCRDATAGCIGLFGWFGILPPPRVIVGLLGDDGFPAVVHMHMPHGLLSGLVELGERLTGCHGTAGFRMVSRPLE